VAESRHVDGHKRPVSAPAELMDDARQHAFTNPGFTCDHDIVIAFSANFRLPEHKRHRFVMRDHRPKSLRMSQIRKTLRPLEQRHALPELIAFQRVADGDRGAFRVQRVSTSSTAVTMMHSVAGLISLII